MAAFKLADALLAWHQKHGRHDLPWQHPRTPYRVWLSEIMLQQTQVVTVIAYFEAFIKRFADLPSLAKAPSADVMQLWAGLGYYSRARNLHKTAQICLAEYAGELPQRFDQLVELPGIGRSTAGAILSQAHGQPFAILDGNVKRVLSRVHAISGDVNASAVLKQLWQIAESHLPKTRLADYSQAIMDLGATVCTRSKPKCSECPLQKHCQAYASDSVSDYPNRKASKSMPTRETFVLVIINQGDEILLEQRPQTGIWGGLYSLPEAADAEHSQLIVSRLVMRPTASETVAPFKHTFSHFHLEIRPLLWRNCAMKAQISDNDNYRWIARSQLAQIGLPAPIKKLLQALP